MRHLCTLSAAAAASLSALALGQPAADLADISLGQDVAGELTADDEAGERGYADRFAFAGAAGTTIEIAMTSTALDCYVMLDGPDGVRIGTDDDSGDGTDSMLRATLPVDGRYTITATSFSSGSTGAYTLRVSEFVAHPLIVSTIALGDSVQGALDDGDATFAVGGYVDGFDIELAGRTTVTFQVESWDFDTYLTVVGPTGERIHEDDDGAGSGTNSRVRFTVPTSGRYRVLVSGYGGYGMGAYTLTATEGEAAARVAAAPIEVGVDVSGTLGEGDEPGANGGHQDRFSLDLAAGRQVVVSLKSDDIDTFVSLAGPDGFVVASDDDSGGDLDSLLTYVVTAAGTYEVIATSYDGSDGAYTLRVDLEAPVAVVARELRVGETVTGRLEPGDARLMNGGGFVDVYTFQGEAGAAVDIGCGENWDVTPQIYTPTGEPFGWDSPATRGVGFSNLGLPFTGEYRITVTSYGQAPADYTLTLSEAGSAPEVEAVPIEIGQPVEGSLDDSDPASGRGGRQDVYALRVDEASTFRIAMTSEIIDGFLVLQDADGTEIAVDDDTIGLDPVIRTFLSEGDYRIIATEYAGGGGPYRLTVEPIPTVPVTVESIEIGDHVVGRLDDTDAISVTRGNTADFFRIELGGGQTVTITMTSSELDAYLIVLDPTGEEVVSDDDSGGNLDARGTFTPATSGVFTIVATGYDQRSGGYELHVYEGTVSTSPGPEL